MDQTDFMQKIASQTFEEVTKKIVERFFSERWGYGSQKDVEAALKDAVTKMIETDTEIQALMRARLIDIIKGGQGDARPNRRS